MTEASRLHLHTIQSHCFGIKLPRKKTLTSARLDLLLLQSKQSSRLDVEITLCIPLTVITPLSVCKTGSGFTLSVSSFWCSCNLHSCLGCVMFVQRYQRHSLCSCSFPDAVYMQNYSRVRLGVKVCTLLRQVSFINTKQCIEVVYACFSSAA